jgi:hypothetical protein
MKSRLWNAHPSALARVFEREMREAYIDMAIEMDMMLFGETDGREHYGRRYDKMITGPRARRAWRTYGKRRGYR